MFHRIREVFKTRPFIANMVSYGVTYTTAEVTQQMILLRTDPTKDDMDWRVIGRYATVSIVGLAPLLFYWYKFLDAKMPGRSNKIVLMKVIIDQAVAGTGALCIFFTGMGLLERRDDVFAELKAKFVSTYTKSCCFWLPAQAINFGFLPPYTRVAFVGVASFIWVNILCLVKRQEFEEATKKEEITGKLFTWK